MKLNQYHIFFLCLLFCACGNVSKKNILDHVDPFIGTGGHGHTFPGPTMPFGMVQVGPDTRLEGWDGCSGYHFSDDVVYGFSHTHLSGTGVSDYGDVLLMPYSGNVKLENGYKSSVSEGYASHFDKSREVAKPAYYSTYLTDYNIQVELTATDRSAFHRYTFNGDSPKNIVLDLAHRDKLLDSDINVESDKVISGKRISQAWAQEQHIYFFIEFSEPFSNETWNETKEIVSLLFENGNQNEILVKIGISAVSIENAKLNLQEENPGWSFEEVREKGEKKWLNQLSKIEVEGTEKDKIKFYTALYHTMIAPNLFTDVNGDYRGMDMNVHNVKDDTFQKDQYSVFSLWDTFRAIHPLFTIIETDKTNAFIQSFLRQYREGGLLPVWELAANETNCMIGYHSVPVIADAYVKNIRDYDLNLALSAMQKSAMQDDFGLRYYKDQNCIYAGDESESVSKTLAYAYDDWCISTMAKSMGDQEVAKKFLKRSENWKNLFDPSTGFFRARVNHSWFSPFKPEEVNFNYTEANAWQYSAFVPHDIYALDSMMPHGLENHLDRLFSASEKTSGREQADITGLIGQYAHGNEPSHHMAYLYNYTGRPDKSQFMLHRIKEELYTTESDGLSGNEDCGQMSAWYVLSAMAFYSVTPGSDYYVLGTPTFSNTRINLENGNVFEIEAKNLSKQNFYIHGVKLNGQDYNKTFIHHTDIMKGGKIIFEMGDEPSDWGRDEYSRPPNQKIRSQLVSTPFFSTPNTTFQDSLSGEISSLCKDCEIWVRSGDFNNWSPWSNHTDKCKFVIKEDHQVETYACHEGKGCSDTIRNTYHKLHDKIKIKLLSSYENQYSAGGDKALIDMQTGSSNFRTGRWQGYQGQDLEFEIDLGEIRNGIGVRIGFLQDIRSWIWLPKEVQISFSKDGENWIERKQLPEFGFERKETSEVHRFREGYMGKVRYVKVRAISNGPCPDWHLGAGGASWIFADEIEIF